MKSKHYFLIPAVSKLNSINKKNLVHSVYIHLNSCQKTAQRHTRPSLLIKCVLSNPISSEAADSCLIPLPPAPCEQMLSSSTNRWQTFTLYPGRIEVKVNEGWGARDRESEGWTLTCNLCPPDRNADWSWWESSALVQGLLSPTRTAGRAGRRWDSPGRSGSPRCGSL